MAKTFIFLIVVVMIFFASCSDKKAIAKVAQSEKQVHSYPLDSDLMDAIADIKTWKVENVNMVVLNGYADLVLDGDTSKNPVAHKLAAELRPHVKHWLIVEMPRMRKVFADKIAKKVWEDDMYISCSGERNEILNITAGGFAANKNIAAVQDKLDDELQVMRFKQSRYRWYKGADEYTSYTIHSRDDGDIIR